MVGPHTDPSPDPRDDPYGDLPTSVYSDTQEFLSGGRHHLTGAGSGAGAWPVRERGPDSATDPAAPASSNAFRSAPYVLTRGRTEPSSHLDMMSLVRATGRARGDHLGITHAQALQLCQKPVSVAEVAAKIRQPLNVAKVILSDLIEVSAVIASAPRLPDSFTNDPQILEAVLDGLRNLK
jgi:hypothetical protein